MIKELQNKYKNFDDINFEVIANALKMINDGYEFNNDDLIELSKLRTNSGADALLVAVINNMDKAVNYLVKPIKNKKTVRNTTVYEKMNPQQNYRTYKNNNTSYVVDENEAIISVSNSESINNDEIYLYDLFNKNKNGDYSFRRAYKKKNNLMDDIHTNKIFDDLNNYYFKTYEMGINNPTSDDISFILSLSYCLNENIQDFLKTIPNNFLKKQELFNYIYAVSNGITPNNNQESIKDVLNLLVSKCSSNSSLLSIKNILENRNVDDTYKDMIQLLFILSNFNIDKNYLDTINQLNNTMIQTTSSETIKNNCKEYSKIYNINSDDLIDSIDKPVNIIEAKFGKKLIELLNGVKQLDEIQTKKVLDGMIIKHNNEDIVISPNKLSELKKAGIESINVSQCDFTKTNSEVLAKLVQSELNVIGLNKNNALYLLSDEVQKKLNTYPSSNPGINLSRFINKADINDISIIDEMIDIVEKNDYGDTNNYNLLLGLQSKKKTLLDQINNNENNNRNR